MGSDTSAVMAFGLFQFVMPIIGWLAGLTVVEYHSVI